MHTLGWVMHAMDRAHPALATRLLDMSMTTTHTTRHDGLVMILATADYVIMVIRYLKTCSTVFRTRDAYRELFTLLCHSSLDIRQQSLLALQAHPHAACD